MRSSFALCLAALMMASVSLPAAADNSICRYELTYDVDIDTQGLRLTRSGQPDVRIHDGALWIDDEPADLTTSERKRLRQYERDMRRFTEEATSVALDGVALGLRGATLAVTAVTGREPDRDVERRMKSIEQGFRERLDGRHLSNELFDQRFDAELDEAIESLTQDLMADMVGGVGQLVAMALFAPSRLEARAQSIDQQVSAQIDAQANQLERRADGLCRQVETLDMLENSIGRFSAFDRQRPSI